MDQKTKEIYSEVYEILNQMGDRFISKLPNKLFELIKNEKLDSYNPKYNLDVPLEEQNIKEDTIDMIALLYLNYWCEDEEEKRELSKVFQENEEKHQKELNEKYNTDNLFKNRKTEENGKKEVSLMKYKKSLFWMIIDKIKQILEEHKKEKGNKS